MLTVDANEGLGADTQVNLTASSGKSALLRVAAIAKNDSEKGMKLASREFAGMFLGQMMKNMRSTVDVSDFMNGGQAEKIFQGMLDDEWARDIAYSGNIEGDSKSFAGMVYDSMKRNSAASAYGQFLKTESEGNATANIGGQG